MVLEVIASLDEPHNLQWINPNILIIIENKQKQLTRKNPPL